MHVAVWVRAPHVHSTPCGGPSLEELSGGNWMVRCRVNALRRVTMARTGFTLRPDPDLDNILALLREGNPVSNTLNRVDDAGFTIVTWLILPVVICLSQRLSHVSTIKALPREGFCEWTRANISPGMSKYKQTIR